jgi:hypothetical protein
MYRLYHQLMGTHVTQKLDHTDHIYVSCSRSHLGHTGHTCMRPLPLNPELLVATGP